MRFKILYTLTFLISGFCFSAIGKKVPESAETIELFVSVDGNDQNSGTIDQPLASLKGARDAIRKLSSQVGVTVYFRTGTYFFRESCTFSELDSGRHDKPIIYRNYKNEKVTFHGGLMVNPSLVKSVKDKNIWNRLPVESRKHVVRVNLKEIGINDYGQLNQHGFAIPVSPAPTELFFNQQPLTRARWPNSGILDIGEVIDPGSNFRNGDKTKRGAKFRFEYERLKKWSKADNIWISGLFSNAWSDDNLKIEFIDSVAKIIKLVQPHLYSVQSSSTDKDKLRGFYVYNLLEEIDQPGEWFLDEMSGVLYLWPPSEILSSSIELSLLGMPFIKVEHTAHLKFEGFNFECARGMAIWINDSRYCVIANAKFKNLGTVAISLGSELQGGDLLSNADGSPKREDTNHYLSSNILIDNCTIYNVGTGGILLAGGDRKNLKPANNIIQNCEIYKFSRINKTYSPAVTLNGVGNVVRNCFIHDAGHQAISFLGNDHLIAFNHFKTLCKATHDMGAIYTGRDPSSRGTKIQYNFFEDIGSDKKGSVCSVYLDDGSGGIDVSSNVFYKAASPGKYKYGAVFIHGGGDNVFCNNIFIDCEQAFGNTPWGDKKWKEFVSSPLLNERLFEAVNIHTEHYKKAYPELVGFTDTTKLKPRINRTFNSLFYGSGEFSTGSGYAHKDALITSTDPGFYNSRIGDYRLKKNAVIFKALPGFRSIPFEKIGMNKQISYD